MSRAVIFLDRDGTLIEDKHYLDDPWNIDFKAGVFESLSLCNDLKIPVIIVTNQSGINRGLFTHKRLKAVHDSMLWIMRENGCYVDAIYYCPHRPDEYCSCRKPGTELFKRAAIIHDVDVQNSWLIGDTIMDAGAAISLGCNCMIPNKSKYGVQRAIEHAAISIKGTGGFLSV